MPVCGFGFPHICPDGEAVLHPARRKCSPGIWNLSGMPQRIKKKTKTKKEFPLPRRAGVTRTSHSGFSSLISNMRGSISPLIVGRCSAPTYSQTLYWLNAGGPTVHLHPGSEGRDLPWTLFYSASLPVISMANFLFAALWFLHLLVEWVIRPSGASEGHVMGLNRSQHWRYFKATYTPPGWQQPRGMCVSQRSYRRSDGRFALQPLSQIFPGRWRR